MAAPPPHRLHTLAVLALTLGLLGGGVWIYLVLLQTSFGTLPWRSVLDTSRTGRVALLDSRYTAELHRARGDAGLGVDADWVAATVRDWRAYLLNRQIPFGEISDADLEAGALDGYDILVLPAAQALSDAQLEQLRDALRAGISVLATWTPGVYRPDGSWRGHAVLDELVGAEFTGFVPRGGAHYRVSRDTFPGTALAGLYRPAHAVEAPAPDARAGDFAPLGGYVWTDSLDAPRPAAAFALAEAASDSTTAVAYYTWLGGDPTAADASAAAFRRFTLRGGTPLTAGLPAGYQLRAGSFDAPVTARPVEPRVRVAGGWYDYTADDRLPGAARAESAGLLYGRYGAGRIVFLGHELAAMGVGPDDQRVLARLFDNAFAWLARRSVGWLADWPAPYRSAAVLAAAAAPTAADAGVAGLDALRAALEPRGVPATYFVPADYAQAQAETYRRLAAHGEVALLAAPDPTPVSLRQQRARLAEVVGLASGARVVGSAADDPYAAVAGGGLAYAVTDSVADRAVPALVALGEGSRDGDDAPPLVRLHRTSRSPAATLRRLPDAALQAQYAREDAERVIDAGGLAVLTFDGEDFRSGAARPMLDAAVDALQGDGAVWFATAREVATWWQIRRRLTLDVQHAGPRRVTLRVANDGTATARDVGVTVALGQLAAGIEVAPELVGTPTPAATLSADGETVHLVVGALAPGASQTIHVDVEPTGLFAAR